MEIQVVVFIVIFYTCVMMCCIRLIVYYVCIEHNCDTTDTYQNASIEPVVAALETDLPVVSTATGVLVTEVYVV